MNSIVNSGLSGMLHSQQAMQQSAHNIASTHSNKPALESVGANGVGAARVDPPKDAASANNTVNAPSDPSRTGNVDLTNALASARTEQNATDPARDLINLQQQEQLFTASASVVEVGAEAVGSLIDDYS